MTSYNVRRCVLRDLPAWWDLRLLALQESPDAFGSDYETSKQRGPTYAEQGFFDDGPNALFAALSSDGTLVAQAAVYAEAGKRSHIAHVISVYTHPDHRGHKLAPRLVQAGVGHLRRFPQISSIRISADNANHTARRIYEQIGFVSWGEEPDAIRRIDGSCDNECHMVLQLGSS